MDNTKENYRKKIIELVTVIEDENYLMKLYTMVKRHIRKRGK